MCSTLICIGLCSLRSSDLEFLPLPTFFLFFFFLFIIALCCVMFLLCLLLSLFLFVPSHPLSWLSLFRFAVGLLFAWPRLSNGWLNTVVDPRRAHESSARNCDKRWVARGYFRYSEGSSIGEKGLVEHRKRELRRSCGGADLCPDDRAGWQRAAAVFGARV